MTNMTNMHTCAFSCMKTILSRISIIGGELVQLTSDMISSSSVIVPVGVNSGKVGTLVCTILSFSTIIFIVPPTITSGMAMNKIDLASGVDILGGLAITTSTTIITSIFIIMMPGTLIPAARVIIMSA